MFVKGRVVQRLAVDDNFSLSLFGDALQPSPLRVGPGVTGVDSIHCHADALSEWNEWITESGLPHEPDDPGGDILFVESTRVPGSGRLILTGQLGEVMRESAQAALSLVKSRAVTIGIDPSLFEKSDIHIHVPAGAIPKDGPSAGVAMVASLVSLMTGRTVRNDTAMTGEISLRGLVLPVGGIKEKTAAAARAGLARVLLPARNRKDLEEISEDVRQRLEFVWLERVDDLMDAALEARAAEASPGDSAQAA